MSSELVFLMGKYEARLPGEFRYARNHMWCRPGVGRRRFGFTSYAIRLMQDVYFLDWLVSAGAVLAEKQQIGHIETSKAVADLFAPMAGTLAEFNAELLDDPTPINVDGYGAGWLFEMEGEAGTLLTVQEYHEYLAANWEKTQRLLKGQVNRE